VTIVANKLVFVKLCAVEVVHLAIFCFLQYAKITTHELWHFFYGDPLLSQKIKTDKIV
jgi:hypothetical protein